ncbi:MAG: FKBP-type peptidyl-prolyl cis-trans isomerase [Methanomassiliicoccaceae archaeon]|nr:FKBP-type peptidyl-prolyl cis-trans isomerase [Methanomassiliicoccaceae archaeon]
MAEDEIKVKKERDPIMTVCFVIFLVAVIAVSGASVYNNYLKADDTFAATGNTVSVNYIGTYYAPYGSDNAVVFDTSYWKIANDDNILKSNGFTLNSESSYKPLSFEVGAGTVLTLFGNGVIGHKVGDKFNVEIPAGEGYNAPDTMKTISASAVFTIPSSEVLTATQFNNLYGYDLKGYAEMEKSVYGWPATASYNSYNDTITMSYHPVSGTSYYAVDNEFGKVALSVTSASGGSISFKYVVSDFTEVSRSGADIEIQMIKVDFGKSKFYITSVTAGSNGNADTFTYKTVEERFNQKLYFQIELVSIG